jgi:uncharacterized membrane protein
MRVMLVIITFCYITFGFFALYGLQTTEVIETMNKEASIGEQVIWQSLVFGTGLMCLGFAITWLIIIPWHTKRIKKRIKTELENISL